MFGGFSSMKLKTQLKMAVSRIQIASNKKTALLKQNMREVAVLLAEEPPKEEMASIKAEALIRDDHLLEAMEILQLECEMLHERIKLLEFSKTCPEDLVSVISTVMWASHRVDIPELILVRKQFRAKYGKKFEDDALANKNNILNERVVAKLSVQPPAAFLVQCYLERICSQFEVDWTPKVKLSASQMVEPMQAPVGFSVGAGQGTGLGPAPTGPPESSKTNAVYSELPPVVANVEPFVPPAAPTTHKTNDFEEVDIFVPPGAPPNSSDGNKNDNDTDNNIPPPAPSGGDASTGGASSTSYEDLAARFNNLKKM